MKSINPYIAPRDRMVLEQLAARGVNASAFSMPCASVAREAFVPEDLRQAAYSDQPLPIGEGQTISQPYIVAAMAEALGLQGDENVLEIGTGSGYDAAVLAHIARAVHTIERIPSLARRARETCGDWATTASRSSKATAAGAGCPPRPTTPSSQQRRRRAFPPRCAPSSGRADGWSCRWPIPNAGKPWCA